MPTLSQVAGTALLAARSISSSSGIQELSSDFTGTSSYLPDFLTHDDTFLSSGFPWGTHQANDTDYYTKWPDTGVVRHYDFILSEGPCAPDGIEVNCFMVNGQVPGPLIEANWGDWIEVNLTNALTSEGTSIHWHGFLQKETPWMDGVPGVQQCPLAPGTSFTYKFQATLYGSAWYHSHYDAQAANGAFGPMVVYGPKNAEYDHDLGPVVISDWIHEPYQNLVDDLMQPLPNIKFPSSDNNLINGMNPWPGQAARTAKYFFKTGKTYRLRLINAGCAATQKITIDEHKFTVIANDFVPVNPYTTDHVTLAVGQRSDVLVTASMDSECSVWLRSWIAPCSQRSGMTEAKAAIYYEDADYSQLPTSSPGPTAYDEYCGNDDLEQTTPYFALAPPDPSVESIIPVSAQSNGTHLLWYMAGRTFRTNYNDPDLLEAKLGNLDFPYIENVHNYGTNSSILFVVENTSPLPHPMHLHGHNLWILAEGECTSSTAIYGPDYPQVAPENPDPSSFGSCWDGHITNAQNPQRRDVQQLLPGHYIVIQWNQDNPGVWPFHCHLTWHGAAGFVMTILERPDEIKDMDIPSANAQTCRDWSAWTGKNIVLQIDDGL